MPDMLVKLYELPEAAPALKQVADRGVEIRRPIAPEKHVVVNWVREHFGEGWASETEVAFSNHPVSCYIAIEEDKLIGFACYESTCKAYFGPTGVGVEARGKGVGGALLIASMHGLRELGYAYGIIGGAGPVEFYRKTLGAIPIEGSVPGIYKGMLK
ncbi:GNAT family N-acetyltransferase [Paenibacillus koleovorans]|uniref:GNAT family N-acetyltransferase n=1 Tax=Paenibacillus koleovorans TaxID=121608 RepID=UPI000FD77DB3|nr:GNAT family N-acetyltransferase [Paenibacillus koleovorans]